MPLFILSLKDKKISEITVSKDTITIGRDPQNDVHIANPSVSRYHAKVRRIEGGAFYVDDLESTNGTYINGTRVSWRAVLNDHDLITVGKYTLEFIAEPDTGKGSRAETEGPTVYIK